MLVAGVDGCPRGWLAVFRHLDSDRRSARIFGTFAEVVAEMPLIIAVDIPIGLPKTSKRGGRRADCEARRFLGQRRQSSVFPAPCRAAINAETFAEACQIERYNSNPSKGLSQQVFNIRKKIKEVDDAARRYPALIYECHPEVSFCAMNGNEAMQCSKKRKRGRDERCDHLARNGYTHAFATTRIGTAREHSRDDLIDACAAAWTAERIFLNDPGLIVLPQEIDQDDCNLCMAIWA